MKIIDNFHEYSFLSNFSPNKVWFDVILWPTAEHAYQASKTLSAFAKEKILECKTPVNAKRLGKTFPIREDFELVKLKLMFAIVKAKFEQDPGLNKMLRDLTDYWLIEGNDLGDQFWGCVKVNGEWVGKNHLGCILMDIRDEFDSSIGWWNKKDKPWKDQ